MTFALLQPYVNNLLLSRSFSFRGDLACQIAYDAVKTVSLEENGRKEIDIKRYAKVEKVSHVCTVDTFGGQDERQTAYPFCSHYFYGN